VTGIIEIIREIPALIQYVVPGFIFLRVLYFLNAKKESDHSISLYIIKMVVVSYIIISIIRVVDAIVLPSCNLWVWTEVIIASFIAIPLAYVSYKFLNSKKLSSFLGIATRKSANDNLWKDVIDYDKGTIFKMFMKNKTIVYIGKLATHEERGENSWFLLTEYICVYTDKDETFDSSELSKPSRVMIPLREVERVEILYDSETDIFNEWTMFGKNKK